MQGESESKAGDASVNKPVSSPTEELRKDNRRSDHSGRQENTRPGLYIMRGAATLLLLFIY